MSVLVQNSVKRTLFAMAFPMLAVIGFTFPVIMLLSCVSIGLGSGWRPMLPSVCLAFWWGAAGWDGRS